MAALTLADAPPRHDNHFNLIRFLAATAVIYSHGFNAVAGPTGTDALKACIGISFGEIAVDVFFCLSGFLVAGSLLNRGSIRAFAAARALRIYPALILSVVVAVFLVGPLFTTLPLAEYFQDKMTWGYLTRNCLSINPQWFRYELPGVFNDLPSAGIINSPMWTLPWEICMYLSLGILFCMRIFRGSTVLVIWICSTALYILALRNPEYPAEIISAWRFLSFFYGGAALFFHRARAPRSPALLAGAVSTLAVCLLFGFGRETMAILLPYTTIALGYAKAPVLLSFNRIGDGSYGLYIYAFPLQQALVATLGITPPWVNSLLTFALIYPAALISWHFMEKRALAFKRFFH